MNTKIKLLAVAAAAMFSTSLYAQDMTYDAGKTTIGVRGGVNFQNITGKDATGNDLENNIRTGYHFGVNAEVPLGTGFYLQPGILYSAKGGEFPENEDHELHINYIEVPVNFVYKPVLGTGRMLLGFGPYAAYAIGGKNKLGGSSDSNKFDIEFENERPASATDPRIVYMRAFDMGANLLAGYELANNLSFQINAQLGLTNNYPEVAANPNDETKWKNTGFGFSVGYRF